MGPADLRREPSEHAEAAAGRHLDHLERVRHNHALLLVVGLWDALEALPAKESTTGQSKTIVNEGRSLCVCVRFAERLRLKQISGGFRDMAIPICTKTERLENMDNQTKGCS